MNLETHRQIAFLLRAAALATEQAEPEPRLEEIQRLAEQWWESLLRRERALLRDRHALAAVADPAQCAHTPKTNS